MTRLKEKLLNVKVFICIIIIMVIINILIKLFCPPAIMDFFNSFGSFVTIGTGLLAYMTWRNTQKLIREYKTSKISVGDDDIIVAVSLSFNGPNIENGIKNGAPPALKRLISDEGSDNTALDGSPASKYRDDSEKLHDLTPSNKSIHLTKSNIIKRGFLISGDAMPLASQDKLDEYLHEFRSTIKKLYDIMNESNCPKIHLFMAGPVALSALITPYFVNNKEVLIYHWSDNKYYCLGPVDYRQITSEAHE